jgi:hypothetical protein
MIHQTINQPKRNTTMASSAKQSSLDRLHKLFVDELTAQLKGTTDPETGERVPPTAAVLNVIGQTLYRAGTKPVNDSPTMTTLRTAYDSLPFRVSDADGTEKAN